MSSRDPAPSHRRAVGAALAGTLFALAAGAAWAADQAPAEAVKPVWVQQPTMVELMRVYPRAARDRAKQGMAVIDCRVANDGTLGACTVENQKPAQFGFGEAGLKLTPYFRMDAKDVDGRQTAGAAVRIPILFKLTE